jgi:hypothetical protein
LNSNFKLQLELDFLIILFIFIKDEAKRIEDAVTPQEKAEEKVAKRQEKVEQEKLKKKLILKE